MIQSFVAFILMVVIEAILLLAKPAKMEHWELRMENVVVSYSLVLLEKNVKIMLVCLTLVLTANWVKLVWEVNAYHKILILNVLLQLVLEKLFAKMGNAYQKINIAKAPRNAKVLKFV